MMPIIPNFFALAATDVNGAQPCDSALIQQLVQEIKELTLSNAAATFNCHCSCNGGHASYLFPAAAVVAAGFCYMWWKGFLFSNVMYATATKQLENLIERIAPNESRLTEKVEALSLKVDEHNELTQLNAHDVSKVKSGLSQIGRVIESISEKIPRMEGELKLAESKQDMTMARIRHLGKLIIGFCMDQKRNISEEVSAEQGKLSSLGLQTICTEGSSSKAIIQKPCQINIPRDGDTIG